MRAALNEAEEETGQPVLRLFLQGKLLFLKKNT